MASDTGDDLDARAGAAEAVRDVFESMPLLLIGLAGPQHEFVAVNHAYRSAFFRDDLIGASARDVFPEVEGQQWFESMDRVLATGVPQVAQGWRLQVANRAGDGFDEHFFDLTFAPRRDAAGAVVGLNVFGVDTTERELERRRVQEEVAEAVQRYERARDVITALQRQLLPAGLPVLPSVRVAASYLLADADDAAGGDWFDAVPVPGGRVALVVGDVVGHGVEASAAMGQLRAVLEDRLDDTGDVLGAVAAADRMARRVPGARAATVCVMLLDAADGALTWCSAGHPPPLIAGPGSAQFLPASGQGPLGTGAAYTVLRDRLEPGHVVLLYSDGIIERPGRTPAAATAELAQVVSDLVAGRGFHDEPGLSVVDRTCTQTLELLVRQTGYADDITLLAAQRRLPAAAPLHIGGPGALPTIAAARSAVDAWADVLEAREEDRVALLHAVVELVTNALEHARPDTADVVVAVTAELGEDGEVRLVVEDNGQWRERARPGDDAFRKDHGFGLAMAASLADHLDVDRGDNGTTVTVRRRLSRSARLLTADQISQGLSRAAEDAAELMLILDQPNAPSSRIAVHGPLDASTVEELGVELDRYTLGGTHDLIVDLTAVTHLASAAVAELYRTRPGSAAFVTIRAIQLVSAATSAALRRHTCARSVSTTPTATSSPLTRHTTPSPPSPTGGASPAPAGSPPPTVRPPASPPAVPCVRTSPEVTVTGYIAPSTGQAVRAVLFDTFGTVVDWRSGISSAVRTFAADRALTLDPEEFADAWRAQYQPSMERVRSGQRPWISLDTLHSENLETVLRSHNVDPSAFAPGELTSLAAAWHYLPPWPDSVEGIRQIKRDFIVGPLSNGTTALLVDMAKAAGLPWDVILGSDISRAYKPSPDAYRKPAALLGLDPGQVMLAAAHNSDLEGARTAGLATAFIARPAEYGPHQASDLTASEAWDLTSTSITNLARQLLDDPPRGH